MGKAGRRRRARHAFGLLIALLVIGASSIAAPAVAQNARRSNDQLVAQLVLNSAVLRQAVEQRAAQEKFALFQRLAERDTRITAALADVKLERNRRRELEAELETTRAERQSLVDELARQSAEFATERNALIEQMTGLVTQASPAKREALQRFANGERDIGYERVKQLTFAENAARSRAADLASAQNLKSLLTLTNERLVRGEATIDEQLPLLRQIVQLDPADVEMASRLARALILFGNNTEAVELAAKVQPYLLDDWQKLDFESSILHSRIAAQPISEALEPLLAVVGRLESQPRATWPRERMNLYCRVILDLVTVRVVAFRSEGIIRLAEACVTDLSSTNIFNAYVQSLLTSLVARRLEQRNTAEASRYIGYYKAYLDNFPDLPKYPLLNNHLRSRLALMELGVAMVEGRRKEGLLHLRNAVEMFESIVPIMGSKSAEGTDEIASYKAALHAAEGRYREAISDLQPLVQRQPASSPPLTGEIDQKWISRQVVLTLIANAHLMLREVEPARRALSEASEISIALQRLHPLDEPALLRATHISVYDALMDSAIARARLRGLEGNYSEADRTLSAVLSKLAPFMAEPIYTPAFDAFNIRAHILLAELAAQQGDTGLARARLTKASDALQSLRTKEPHVFMWVSGGLEIRFRLAQIEGDFDVIRAVRLERDKLAAEGKPLDDLEPWVKDLANWRPGQPIRWFP